MIKNGKIWPYAIGISIALVFSFCIATVVVTHQASVQESDVYMTNYQDADARADDIFKARLAFDNKYNIKYMTKALNTDSTIIKYKVTDKNLNPINNAVIKILVSRPDDKSFNIELKNPSIESGVYTFNAIKLSKQGRWDVMAQVDVDKLERFYNLHADTRTKEAFEF